MDGRLQAAYPVALRGCNSANKWVSPAQLSVVMGESIALGIFLTPAAMARSLGSPLLLAAVWCGMGLITLCGALCYSELSVRFPVIGGEYVYLREGYGTRLAFLYGWMSAAVMDPRPRRRARRRRSPLRPIPLRPSPTHAIVIPALILIGLALLNYVGTRLSRRVMTTANLLKVAVLVASSSGHVSPATRPQRPLATNRTSPRLRATLRRHRRRHRQRLLQLRRMVGGRQDRRRSPQSTPHGSPQLSPCPTPFALNGCNPDFLNVDLTASRKFGDWEFGLVAFGSTDLNSPVDGYLKQSQIAVGGLIGKSFGTVILQAYLTTDVYEKNYGGHDTRLWGRFIIPVWQPPTPTATPFYRKG